MNDDEVLRHYSRALDEVYRLRVLLADESDILRAHLDFKTFPKSRRRFAEEQVERMRLAACGHSEQAMSHVRDSHAALKRVGAPTLLTRHLWEESA